MNQSTTMPSPQAISKHPLIQRLQWIADPVGYMHSAVQEQPDLFIAQVQGFGGGFVFVNHPQAIQEILTGDRKRFLALSRENHILEPLLGNTGVIMLDGDRHSRRRQLLMPPFHGDRMRTYAQQIMDRTIQVVQTLTQGQPLIARSLMQSISLQVILEVVYGLSQGERFQQIKALLSEIGDLFESPLKSSILLLPSLQKDLGAWSPWGHFVRKRTQIDQLVYAEIADRRAHPNPDRTDILSLLMAARDEEGNPLSDRELRDELMTLMFAGHETTATAMSWALYWIHKQPGVRANLLEELNDLGEHPDPTLIAKLPYLTAVCQETLRIHPVGMLTFPRIAQSQTELMGYRIEAGTVLMGCIYLLHQREDLYPNAQEFRPERFLDRQFSPYEFMPFGGGTRRCIGEALAQFEMKLVLATLLRQCDLALADDRPEQPRRRGVTLAPGRGVRMKVVNLHPNRDRSRLEQIPIPF